MHSADRRAQAHTYACILYLQTHSTKSTQYTKSCSLHSTRAVFAQMVRPDNRGQSKSVRTRRSRLYRKYIADPALQDEQQLQASDFGDISRKWADTASR